MKGLKALLIVGFFTAPFSDASADCLTEIQNLFKQGPLDPFVMGNRRNITVKLHPDGKTSPVSDVLWDGPFNSINCTPNGCYMGIKNASWSGPSFEGPWTRGNDKGIEDFEAFVRGTNQRLADSVKEAECLGETVLDGRVVLQYRFFSKPEPNEFGSWWGGRYAYWLDKASNRIIRMEISEGIASWAPNPSEDVQVTTYSYDDSIRVTAPK